MPVPAKDETRIRSITRNQVYDMIDRLDQALIEWEQSMGI